MANEEIKKLLSVKDLEVIYKTEDGIVHALNGVSLDISAGETLGLVGETGAGKTTLAFSILKLLPSKIGEITSGTIAYQGQMITEMSEEEMRKIRGEKISMIFQDPMTSLNPIMTIGEQIGEALLLHKKELSKEQVEARVEEMLTLVGIPPARKKEYPHQFSGGMKQRVVIAIALACEPNLLLADEPTTALDVTIQAQVLAMMRELKEKLNTSMILITHDLGVVAESCDKVAIMYAGEIIEYGTLRDVFKGDTHHPYTDGLFGSIPDLEIETEHLSPIDGMMPDPTNLPSGCKFNPRCPMCEEICKTEKPAHIAISKSHMIACHRLNKEL